MPNRSSQKKCVMIVDDSPHQILLLTEILGPLYEIKVAATGEEALTLATESPHPELILLDLQLPGIDGFEVCRRLKQLPETEKSTVIFLSASDSTDDKLTGYDVGARDFLNKPIDIELLLKKVDVELREKQWASMLQTEKLQATRTAMIALTSAGELGIVIEFMRKSYTILQPEGIGKAIVDAASLLGLECTTQIRMDHGQYHLSSLNSVSRLEQDLLSRLYMRGRIVERGNSIVFNFPACSLLVKNMPVDPDARGSLCDNLCLLLECADARLNAMNLENKNSALKQLMVKMINESRQHLDTMHQLNKQRQVIRDTSDLLIKQQRKRFTRTLEGIALSHEQLTETTHELEELVHCLQKNFELSSATEEEITKLVKQITTLLQTVTLS